MKELFTAWLEGGSDPMESLLDISTQEDQDREARKKVSDEKIRRLRKDPAALQTVERMRKRFRKIYLAVAVVCCIMLSGFLLYTISLMPRYGEENPRAREVVERYVEQGVAETGAINIVTGMILDYRAFDTLENPMFCLRR